MKKEMTMDEDKTRGKEGVALTGLGSYCLPVTQPFRLGCHITGFQPFALERGFTRVDLCVVIVLVAGLISLAGFNLLGERGRVLRCSHNLKRLEGAMEGYANDHDGGIPAAFIDLGQAKTSWDAELFAYLEPAMAKRPGAYAKRQLATEAAPRFVCPSDPILRGHPRSYAMPANDMSAWNWPPGTDSATGTGLMWNKQTVADLLPQDETENVMKNPDLLPKVKMSDLPAPADTLLLTEYIANGNTLKNTAFVRVSLANQLQSIPNAGLSHFHFGKFNYLMADGHVELLPPAMTGSAGIADADQPAGIWTMKAGD